MLAAATAIFAEQGYAALSVATVTSQASVSRSTFYKLFDDKLDCVLAAQRRAFEALRQMLTAACASEQDWPGGVACAVGASLAFAARFPSETCLVLASSQVPSEPELARQGLAVNEGLLELLREGAQSHPGARSPNSLAEQAALGAALSIVGTFFAAGEIDALAKRRADLVEIILAPYLGGEEAQRVALTAY